jgi:hypothetical protein
MRAFIRLSLSALLATATTLGVVSTVTAADAPKSQLMNRADLTPFGGVQSASWGIFPLDTTVPNAICTGIKGQKIEFPKANGWEANGQIKVTKRYAAVTEIVRDYGTQESSGQAWQALNAAAVQCPSKARDIMILGSKKSYYNVTQTQPKVAGAVTMMTRSVAVSPDKWINGGSTADYSVYRQAGNAIVEVVYYRNPGVTVKAGTRDEVNKLSQELSARWLTN